MFHTNNQLKYAVTHPLFDSKQFRVLKQSGCVVQTLQWASESADSSWFCLSTVYSGAAMKEEERQDERSPKHHRVCIRPTEPTHNRLSHTRMHPRDTATGRRRNKFDPNRRPKTCFHQIRKMAYVCTVCCGTLMGHWNSNTIQVSCLKYTMQ
jgi:hypothetical protein